jgi:hypothetical protein
LYRPYRTHCSRGSFVLSVSDVVCYRVRARGTGIMIASSSFMLFVWGSEIVVNRANELCVKRKRDSRPVREKKLMFVYYLWPELL